MRTLKSKEKQADWRKELKPGEVSFFYLLMVLSQEWAPGQSWGIHTADS